MTEFLLPLHMGALHPMEQLLVLGVAFGPFLVLIGVVYVGRRRAVAEERQERDGQEHEQDGQEQGQLSEDADG